MNSKTWERAISVGKGVTLRVIFLLSLMWAQVYLRFLMTSSDSTNKGLSSVTFKLACVFSALLEHESWLWCGLHRHSSAQSEEIVDVCTSLAHLDSPRKVCMAWFQAWLSVWLSVHPDCLHWTKNAVSTVVNILKDCQKLQVQHAISITRWRIRLVLGSTLRDTLIQTDLSEYNNLGDLQNMNFVEMFISLLFFH